MEETCLCFELSAPAEPSGKPNRTARRLAKENRMLRRTCAACLAVTFASLAWYAWDGWQTRKSYDLLKSSTQLAAQSAEQRAESYRATADLLQSRLDEAEQSAAEYQAAAEDLQRQLDAVTAAYTEGAEQ